MSRDDVKTRIYSGILRQIMTGEVKPRSRLIEEDLARSYRVSRTPVREVLVALEKDGFIKRIRDHGATVVAFTEDDIEEVYEIRRALECCALPRAIRNLRVADLMDLQELLEDANRKRGPAMHRLQEEADLRLHSMIVNASGNRKLIAFVENIVLFRNAFLLVGYKDDSHARKVGEQHLAIVSALIRRDGAEAERLLASHILEGSQYAIEIYRGRLGTHKRVGTTLDLTKELLSPFATSRPRTVPQNSNSG
jgi:DNA-binding GntR family transcriptional regulator